MDFIRSLLLVLIFKCAAGFVLLLGVGLDLDNALFSPAAHLLQNAYVRKTASIRASLR